MDPKCPKCGGQPDYSQVYAEPWGSDSYAEYLVCEDCDHEWQRIFNYAYTEDNLEDEEDDGQ